MFQIQWYTAESNTCYNSRLSKNIISAITIGFMGMLKREKFIKFVIFDKSSNIVFLASRDYTRYSMGIIKNLI